MKFLIAATFVLFAGLNISAQVWTPAPAPTINMTNQIWRNFRMGQIGNQMAADMARSRANSGKQATAPKAATAAKRSSAYKKEFLFQRAQTSPLVAKVAAAGSADAVTMQQLIAYAWRSYETSFADENRRLGMPFNDVASAMTFYIVGGYLYANDLPGLQSEYSVVVYEQVAGVLAKDAEFMKLNATDKQILSELLVTMGAMPALTFEQNRDKGEMKKIGKANLERIFGTNASKLKITANGVEM